MQKEKKVAVTKKRSKSKLRILLWLLLFLLLLILLLPLILHIKPVQKWLVNKTTKSISEKTQAKVEVGELDFSLFKGLILEEIYISDPDDHSDTILYLGSFSSTLRENITSLRNNSILLNEVHLKNAKLKLNTKVGDTQSGLEKILSSFQGGQSENKNEKSKDFHLGLEKIYFENLDLSKEDDVNGEYLNISLDRAHLAIDTIDLANNHFVFDKLILSNPIVIIEKKAYSGEKVINLTKNGQEENDETKPDNETSSSPNLSIDLNFIEVTNGYFKLDDWKKAPDLKRDGFDVNHLEVTDFNVNASSTRIHSPLLLESSIETLTLNEANGFVLERFNVDSLQMDNQKVSLTNFALTTEESNLGNQLVFAYGDLSDFSQFAQKIEINTELKNAKLSFKDLLYFFPAISNSSFVRKNRSKWLRLSGNIEGTVDNLDTDELSLSISDLITMNGSLSTNALTRPESALINLQVEKFETSLSNLESIIPDFQPPEQFYKLDPIVFKGDIDGFFKDFVVYGTLDSPLGKVVLDTRLDIKKGTANAEYSGKIALENFDLKKWTDNPELGFATFQAEIRDGRGLTSKNMLTDLSAELQSFDFKGYTYTDVNLNGVFEKNRFNGKVTSSDPNAKLDFDGRIFLDPDTKKVESDFKAQINNIDLVALNLSSDFSNFSGNVDLKVKGSKTEDLVGESTFNNFSFNFKGEPYLVDELFITSSPEPDGSRNVQVFSDIISGSISGKFNFQYLPETIKRQFLMAHPKWAEKLELKRSKQILPAQDFEFKFEIDDTENYLELAGIDKSSIKGLSTKGKIDTNFDRYQFDLTIREGDYKNIYINNLRLGMDEASDKSFYNLKLNGLNVGGTAFSPLAMRLKANGDNIELRLASEKVLDSLEKIDLVLQAYPKDDDIIAKFSDGSIDMLSSTWTISPANEIVLGKKMLDINRFIISDNYRSIIVSDVNRKGLLVNLEKFDFELINTIIDYDKIDFTGEGSIAIIKENIFEPSPSTLRVDIPEFNLNDEDYGQLTLDATDYGSSEVSLDLKLAREFDGLLLHVKDFLYNKQSKDISGVITARNLAMNTFEYIIDDGISNTGGGADVDAVLSGTIDNIKLDGVGQVKGGTTTIDYLGAELYFGKEKFIVSDNVIDLTGGKLFDRYGNEATITGRLNHNLFTDFTSDLRMSSSRFLALDTEKGDNPSYFGQGIGDITVDFSGPFSSTDIVVEASAGFGTVINIPVGTVYEDYDQNLIKVVDRKTVFNPNQDSLAQEVPTLEGVDVRMNLTITPEAEINIIFNESLNDVMTGYGDGNMRVVISRQGDFNIFGEYVIDRGEYLFTYFGGVVSKPFTMEKGGQITWAGDPINANINLTANYEDLRAPTNIFLAEFLTNPEDNAEARQSTDIDLVMYLTGTLYEPKVDFDIGFSELQGNLKSLAESKMRILRTNEADLNEQVAGLILFGSFLPSSSFGDTFGSASGLARTGYNTLSQAISNQFSHILSGLLQEALSENGFISGIDFDFSFNKSSQFGDNLVEETNSSIIPDEIEVHLKPRFQNDRWELDYGTSYVSGNGILQSTTIPNYVVHDFNIGFYLTDDRRLKLKAYGKWDKNPEGDDGSKYGLGLNYRKEFGSLTDFKKALSEDLAKLKKQN